MSSPERSETLLQSLDYPPVPLKFGTSGRRGEVIHLTQLEVFINALAELEYLQSLTVEDGGIRRGDEFYFAFDLRPSSTRFVPEQGNRGEIAQAIEHAIAVAGMKPVNLGQLPTPVLTFYAMQGGRGSMMVTGSHIPFDRNGYKTNSAKGELLKTEEAPITARVEIVRRRVYDQPVDESPFNCHGCFKDGSRKLPPERGDAKQVYIERYTQFFAGGYLKGRRLLVYQHSAVGRDLLVDILNQLGAQTIPAGRSETFVPIDTEAIDESQLATIQKLADEVVKQHGPIDAVVSTDGDSDRPLILGVESSGLVRFFGGDLVGMVVAEYLQADAVVVPISCNDAIDRGALRAIVEPKTRIGSPFVIAGMAEAAKKGRKAVCGWEANGGFLTGSDIIHQGRLLRALPTRDAMLPILGSLFSAFEKNLSLVELFERLPRRFSRASLLRNVSRKSSMKIVERFSPTHAGVVDVVFDKGAVCLLDAQREALEDKNQGLHMLRLVCQLSKLFTLELGFGQLVRLNYTDGVRLYFSNGDVAHVRPSGNADELRIYAVADTQQRADAIAAAGVAEPDGILRRLAQME